MRLKRNVATMKMAGLGDQQRADVLGCRWSREREESEAGRVTADLDP